ncbi:hypothetical protein DRN86_01380, partial [Candidatus Geothermarchaeota archaeon]
TLFFGIGALFLMGASDIIIAISIRKSDKLEDVNEIRRRRLGIGFLLIIIGTIMFFLSILSAF